MCWNTWPICIRHLNNLKPCSSIPSWLFKTFHPAHPSVNIFTIWKSFWQAKDKYLTHLADYNPYMNLYKAMENVALQKFHELVIGD